MGNGKHKVADGHEVANVGYDDDTFFCNVIDGWVTTDWLVFNYCPLCGQEMGEWEWTPEPEPEPM